MKRGQEPKFVDAVWQVKYVFKAAAGTPNHVFTLERLLRTLNITSCLTGTSFSTNWEFIV